MGLGGGQRATTQGLKAQAQGFKRGFQEGGLRNSSELKRQREGYYYRNLASVSNKTDVD